MPTDANSVQAGLATLGPNGWTVNPSPPSPFGGGAGVLSAAQTAAVAAATVGVVVGLVAGSEQR